MTDKEFISEVLKISETVFDCYIQSGEIDDLCHRYKIERAAASAQQDTNSARDEICPFYKTNDMAHVGDGLGIPECTCKGKLGKLSPVA